MDLHILHKKNNLFIIYLFVTVLLTMFVLPKQVISNEKNVPFLPGERLIFELRWEKIPAGEVELKVLPIETINGVKSYHFVMTAKTNSFVDFFYKVRQRIDAYTDINMTRSILYKKLNTGTDKRDVIVNFDWKDQKAQYSNFNNKKNPIQIKPGSFDPLSIFYYSRFLDFENNDTFESPVTDGKKCVIGMAKIIRRETIKLKNGTFDTFLIEPDLKHIGGVFKKSKNAKIKLWVTADKRKMPVKIKSKVIVGSFIGELVSYNDAI